MRKLFSLVLLAALGLAGCGRDNSVVSTDVKVSLAKAPAPDKPEEFLKWSMDRYKTFKSYKATGKVSMSFGAIPSTDQERAILFVSPNRFKVVSTGMGGFTQTTVSDGKTLVEYASMGTPATSYPAPDGISSAGSMQMQHPMFCGSLLYQFFGGSENFDGLVDADKGAVTFGADNVVQGEKCKSIKFYGRQQYGHVEAMIGRDTGRVYRLMYDSEPTMKMMNDTIHIDELQKSAKDEIAKMKPGKEKDQAEMAMGLMSGLKGMKLKESNTVENYSNVKENEEIATKSFDTTIPKGLETMSMPAPPTNKPPVPLGRPAPDFEVKSVDGQSVKLSSLRGHVVLIDFWATWCGPCRIGLPETDRLAKTGGPKGLQVLAVSSEDVPTITAFMKENKYSMPSFTDPGGAAQKTYGVDAIPTTVIIDAQGNLSAFFVGLRDKAEIEKAIAKAGLTL